MKKPGTIKNELAIAIVWYCPDQWQRVRDISIDAEQFETPPNG